MLKVCFVFREFTVSYRAIDDYGSETYLFLLSDWDLDAAFIRYSELISCCLNSCWTLFLIILKISCSASEPYLYLQVNLKPFGETGDCESDWEENAQEVATRQRETGFPYVTPKLQGLIMYKVLYIKHIGCTVFLNYAIINHSHAIFADGKNSEFRATSFGKSWRWIVTTEPTATASAAHRRRVEQVFGPNWSSC